MSTKIYMDGQGGKHRHNADAADWRAQTWLVAKALHTLHPRMDRHAVQVLAGYRVADLRAN